LVVDVSDSILGCFKDKDVKINAIETHHNLNLSLDEIVLLNFSNIFETLINRSHEETDKKANDALKLFSNKL
jgi:hypothetical protein